MRLFEDFVDTDKDINSDEKSSSEVVSMNNDTIDYGIEDEDNVVVLTIDSTYGGDKVKSNVIKDVYDILYFLDNNPFVSGVDEPTFTDSVNKNELAFQEYMNNVPEKYENRYLVNIRLSHTIEDVWRALSFIFSLHNFLKTKTCCLNQGSLDKGRVRFEFIDYFFQNKNKKDYELDRGTFQTLWVMLYNFLQIFPEDGPKLVDDLMEYLEGQGVHYNLYQ